MVKQKVRTKQIKLAIKYLERAHTVAKKLIDPSASDTIVEAIEYLHEELEGGT